MTAHPQAVARVASHPGGPVLATMRFSADLRFTSATPDVPALFGVDSTDALLGRTPWEVQPRTHDSPLGHALREVLATREARVVTAPSALRQGRPLWARVSPTANGGVRIAVQFPAERRARPRKRAAAAMALLWGTGIALSRYWPALLVA